MPIKNANSGKIRINIEMNGYTILQLCEVLRVKNGSL